MYNNKFNSITQYDRKFDILFKNISQKGFGCGYFSIITAFNFFNNNQIDKKIHEDNIEHAMLLTKNNKLFHSITFDKLLKYTNIKSNEIICTNIELIMSNVINIEHMFPIELNTYIVIFLKNEKYFVVIVNNNKYYIRDCHMNEQYNFDSYVEFKKYLCKTYQFDKNINIDGFSLSEYSSIEYLIVQDSFKTSLIKDNIFDVSKDDIFDLPDNYIFSENELKIMKKINEINIENFTKPDISIIDDYIVNF